jgi:hypothetical protein
MPAPRFNGAMTTRLAPGCRCGWGARVICFACAALALSLEGCATLRVRAGQSAAVFTTAAVHLPNGSLDLHFAAPATPRPGTPLVLYASGDGGWFGSAVGMFRAIAAEGYPTVGFSSRAFLRLGRGRHTPGRGQASRVYEAILAEARTRLGLPEDTPVVLTGWSRGASLATVTAAPLARRMHVRGVVAIGLSARDDLAADDQASDDDPSLAPAASQAGAYDLFRLLRALAPRRSAVIQATRDGYLPAAAARALLGPDTEARRFFTVDARNHRFSGATEAFEAALRDALAWVSQAPVSPDTPAGA